MGHALAQDKTEWRVFASKACSQNSGFSFGSFKYISAIM